MLRFTTMRTRRSTSPRCGVGWWSRPPSRCSVLGASSTRSRRCAGFTRCSRPKKWRRSACIPFSSTTTRAGYKVHYHDVGVDALWTLEPVKTELVGVLGGPIGAYEDDKYPFLAEEVGILEQRLAAARPTIGICLFPTP